MKKNNMYPNRIAISLSLILPLLSSVNLRAEDAVTADLPVLRTPDHAGHSDRSDAGHRSGGMANTLSGPMPDSGRADCSTVRLTPGFC